MKREDIQPFVIGQYDKKKALQLGQIIGDIMALESTILRLTAQMGQLMTIKNRIMDDVAKKNSLQRDLHLEFTTDGDLRCFKAPDGRLITKFEFANLKD